MLPLLVSFIIFLTTTAPSISALDFLYNSFNATADDLLLIGDAQLEPPVVRLTDDTSVFAIGRFFHSSQIPLKLTSNSTSLSSFSTQFIFSVLPASGLSPSFGIAFVLSGSTSPAGALSGQYFGLFSNATVPTVGPLLAVEFDTGRNPEFNDPEIRNPESNNPYGQNPELRDPYTGAHVGIDLNNIESTVAEPSGYWAKDDWFRPLGMRDGQNIHAWIEFDGPRFEINVTIAPAGTPRPLRPLLTFRDPIIANYVSTESYVGFSSSRTAWLEEQRILAWSLSDTGVARDINTSNLPVFSVESSSSSLSNGAIAGITIGCVFVVVLCLGVYYWFWRKRNQENDEIEDWELEYWPHRYSYEELSKATNGFSKDEVLGSGGFGEVYKATLPNNTQVAVKCVKHNSNQGLREFMAEISSMGRLQHKNLVQMRGWCRKGNELLLVYDYMPNGTLNRWIFGESKTLMGWESRKKVLADVAEGLNYMHHGWDQVVVHRDVKPSNILLDQAMRGRLGDFGLAKLYKHGEVPKVTRVAGTLGYLAPEVARIAAPTEASDVYSFGVVVLEVACGRKPIETWVKEEVVVLIDWVRGKYAEGRLWEAADERIKGEYEVEDMEAVLKLGLACCHPDPLHRPGMRQVLAILAVDKAAPDSSVLSLELADGWSNPGGHGHGHGGASLPK